MAAEEHDQELLSLSQIEAILTMLGKNQRLMKLSDFELETQAIYPLARLVFEMQSVLSRKNAAPLGASLSSAPGASPALDQDLLLVTLLCGLFETETINQFTHKSAPQHRSMEIIFDQVFDPEGFAFSSLEAASVLPQGGRASTANLHDHPTMQSATINSLLRCVGAPEASKEKVLVENSRPLVILLNQLMAHQNLLKLNYFQNICQFNAFFHKSHTQVLTVLRSFVDEFKIDINNNYERLMSEESQN